MTEIGLTLQSSTAISISLCPLKVCHESSASFSGIFVPFIPEDHFVSIISSSSSSTSSESQNALMKWDVPDCLFPLWYLELKTMTGCGLTFKDEPCTSPVKLTEHKHIGDPFLISTHEAATVFPYLSLMLISLHSSHSTLSLWRCNDWYCM